MAFTAPGATRSIHVEGLGPLLRAFDKFDKDLSRDLIWELQEAAEPVRKLTTQLILGGGLGLGAMENMPPTPYYADMRIGVSRRESSVWIAPAWHRGTGAGTSRPNISSAFGKRMRLAINDRADEFERNLEKFLDRLADDWGSHLAA